MQQPHNAYFMDLWLRIGLLNKQIASELPQCSLFALLDIARRVNGEVWGTRSASKTIDHRRRSLLCMQFPSPIYQYATSM